MMKGPEIMSSPLYACGLGLLNEERLETTLKVRRCRSFAVPDEVKEIKRIESKNW